MRFESDYKNKHIDQNSLRLDKKQHNPDKMTERRGIVPIWLSNENGSVKDILSEDRIIYGWLLDGTANEIRKQKKDQTENREMGSKALLEREFTE